MNTKCAIKEGLIGYITKCPNCGWSAAQLFMTLSVGDIVKIEYPYDPRSAGIEQSAEVRWRSRYYNQDFPRTFGLRFIR